MLLIAYFTLLLAPFLSGFFMLLSMAPLSIFQLIGMEKKKIGYLSTVAGAFFSLWCYVAWFNWLEVPVSIWIYLIMIGGSIINAIWRVQNRPNPNIEMRLAALEFLGYTFGAWYFFF